MIHKFHPSSVIFSGILIYTLFTSSFLIHTDSYKVKVDESKIEWTGTKLSGTHSGTINITSGILNNNHGKFNGQFIIDMNSIAVTDLSGDRKAKLEKHLKSDDFFDSENYPTADFKINSLTPLMGVTDGNPNFNVNGSLTMKGITNEISFPAIIKFNGEEMIASGTLKIDRTKYNVKYRSKTFFEDIGDKMIYDEFELKLSIKASK